MIIKSSNTDVSQLRRLFAIDYSGSVRSKSLYHHVVKQIFKKYYQNGVCIMIWDSIAEIINFRRMQQIYKNLEGRDSTDPSQIAQLLVYKRDIPRESLILVTNGHVDSGSVQRSDGILRKGKVTFHNVITYMIGEGGDLSVGAPFSRGCESKTIEIKSNGLMSEIIGAKSVDFSILNSINMINDVSQFNKYFDSLFNATKQKMIGTSGDSKLRSKFDSLERRLTKI